MLSSFQGFRPLVRHQSRYYGNSFVDRAKRAVASFFDPAEAIGGDTDAIIFDAMKPGRLRDRWTCFSEGGQGGGKGERLSIRIERESDIPFLRFSGTAVTHKPINDLKLDMGSCLLGYHVNAKMDLGNFEGIELMVRANKRVAYNIILHLDSSFQDDVLQYRFGLDRDMWTRFHIPFEDFKFTYQGDDRGERPMDGSALETIKIVNTRAGGSFQLDIMKITLVKRVNRNFVMSAVM